MARKTYTREFKLRAVRMVTERGPSGSGPARRPGIRQNLIRNWRRAAEAQGPPASPGPGNPTPAGDGRRRRAENARRRAERDLLKEAAAYFADPPARRSGSSPRTPASGRSPGCATPRACPSPGTPPGPAAPRPRETSGGASWGRRSR